jgi:uncharacterized membrane protein
MKLLLRGTRRYWFHEGLIAIVQKQSGWDKEKVKNFLSENDWVSFNSIDQVSAKDLLDRLEAAGFEVLLQESKSEIIATLGLRYENELQAIKEGMQVLVGRLNRLEELKSASASSQLKQSEAYQKFSSTTFEESATQKSTEPVFAKQTVSEGSRESNIGKYWLSRIGVFTFVLGIVFFISYSFQFIGAWGKILTGIAIGAALLGLGNYLALQEKYKRWSMAAIGGGWAILYFTVYAAYQIPATKVISNPFVGFLCLLLVMVGSISQSLKFKSPVMVFFSYFLGFVALSTVEVSFYTLIASFLLALSMVIVTKKTGWNWLALLGLAAVYGTHYFWLEPSLTGIAGEENWWDALTFPWIGDTWRIYPLISREKSLLHLGFLSLYWLLFTTIGFFKNKDEENRNIAFWLLVANSFIFTTSFIHHLHVYYPALKPVFPFVMGAIFFVLSWIEQKVQRGLVSDLYLSFSVSLFALTLPMYFDGPWITYGWSAAFVILSWLGIRHGRKILYRLGWVLAGTVLLRLVSFDYLESDILFSVWMPVRISFFIFFVAGLALLATFGIYRFSALPNEKEKRIAENCFLIASSLAFAWAFLIGGLRATSSVAWILEGILLMILSVRYQRTSLRIFALLFIGFAALRIISVDCGLPLMKLFLDFKVTARLLVLIPAILAILKLGDWLRRATKADLWLSNTISLIGATLVLRYFYESDLKAWISIIWGACAFIFLVSGFVLKDKLYRWIGLGIFSLVLLRLFFYDFSNLETIYRIISFIALGIVFIGASFLYSYFSKHLLNEK